MIERIAHSRLQRLQRTLPPAGHYRERILGQLKRLAKQGAQPPAVARQALYSRLPDLVQIREKVTRRPVTAGQVDELRGLCNE